MLSSHSCPVGLNDKHDKNDKEFLNFTNAFTRVAYDAKSDNGICVDDEVVNTEYDS